VPDRYDVVVVGGGTAGCVVAARLSENPDRSVCLVEAGPDYGHYGESRWPEDLLDARQLALSHSWETDREDRSQLRARVIGGCSAHNACVVLEGTAADYDEWGPGWTARELRPYLDRARRELRTRTITNGELSPWHRAFVEACGPDAILHPVNAVGQVRWNAAFAYLDPARDRPNLTIRGSMLVDRVVPGQGRVLTDRGELTAGTVVLSAGSYGTAGILLRSGVGPGLDLDLPVGEGLVDHVGVGFGWEPTPQALEELDRFAEGHPVFMAQVTVHACGGDAFLFPALDPGWEISGAVFAMKPWSRGRVTLASADPAAPLRIEHGFLSDERDVATLVEGVETLRALAASPGIARYAVRELRPGPDVQAEAHVRATARGFFHPVSTCAIGRVVDPSGRVLGTDGLLVADASIMPTIPRANTNLTTAAIAERIAELFAG
jgi:choline dehydrogenase